MRKRLVHVHAKSVGGDAADLVAMVDALQLGSLVEHLAADATRLLLEAVDERSALGPGPLRKVAEANRVGPQVIVLDDVRKGRDVDNVLIPVAIELLLSRIGVFLLKVRAHGSRLRVKHVVKSCVDGLNRIDGGLVR